MDIKGLRQELGMTQAEFALHIGLASKSNISQIEKGGRKCSPRVALEIERISGGRIAAANLNPSVALIDQARSAAA